MAELQLPAKTYNTSLLAEELKTALGSVADGVITRKGVCFAILINPTPADEATATNVAAAHNSSGLSAKQQLREQIKTVAQSAEDVPFDQLTIAQLRALYAINLWQSGALNNDGTVKPLSEWVKG